MTNSQDNDPTAWMASLINDIQTARCTYRDITGVRYIKPENVDITAPVFWFDDMFDQGSPIMRGIETGNSLADLYHEDARLLVLNNDFRLPFPKCFFVYRCCEVKPEIRLHKVENGHHIANIVYLDQDQTTFDIECTSFMKILTGFTQIKNWLICPLKWNFGSHLPKGEIEYVARSPLAVDPLREKAMIIDLIADLTAIMVGTMLLNEPKATSAIKLPSGPVHSKANARRSKAGIKPLSDVSYIRLLDPVPYPSSGKNAIAARGPMPPHNRRGTTRHYKSGKVVAVGPMKIRGGAPDNSTHVYKVSI